MQSYKNLKDKNISLDRKLRNSKSRCLLTIVIFLFLSLMICSLLLLSEIRFKIQLFGIIAWGLTLTALVIYLLFEHSNQTAIQEEKREIVFQIDLVEDKVDQVETRAEKILAINRYQIKQYHDFNLRQNRWIFLLGLACVVAGILVVLLTFAVVIFWADGLEDKVIVSVIGAIGSILSNFVGTIYLYMHKSAANALSEFHNKLVKSHRMLLGNLVASRISEKEKRDDVFAKLALEIMSEQ